VKRIIIVHWNKSTGPEFIIQYPPEKKFPTKDLFLKIWAKHELNQDNSMIEFIPGDDDNKDLFISIIQKFEGEIYYLILIHDKKDTIENDYSDILAIISKNLIELINTNKITRAISEAFNTIKNYSKLDKEDILMNFLQDKIKFTILQILRNGVISKLELINTLRNDHGFSTVNIDLLLMSFIREKLILKKNIPGSKECYFLINDVSYVRIPPNKSHVSLNDKEAVEIFEKYKKELSNFYFNYDRIREIENKSIINFLINQDIHSLLKTLREKNLSVNECLYVLNNREELFNELLEKKLIFEAKGFVYLFSDIRFIKFFPYYILKELVKRYHVKEISFNQYITHLKLLTEKLETSHSYMNYEII